MALSRRTGARFQSSIWPGFVDAMTGLLLVLMFVLTIFMVVQFVLRETISGQENELDALSGEVAALAKALGLEKARASDLEERVGALNATVDARRAELETQSALLAALRVEQAETSSALKTARANITSFEAQVASLLAARNDARAAVAGLQGERAALLSDKEALELALAQARSEIDEGVEAARLAAAKREALAALVADLRDEVTTTNTELSETEALRLAESAAAEALRKRLSEADNELTAMTLALEAQRQKAEETLRLLAAAEGAEEDLDAKLASAILAEQEVSGTLVAKQAELAAALASLEAETLDQETLRANLTSALASKLAAETAAQDALSEAEERAALLAAANRALSDEEAISSEAAEARALLNQQVSALRAQLGGLQALLDDAKERDAAANVQLQSLGSDLNAALAQAASEERKRRLLEEAERKRLQAETKNLEKFRSEFFGRLRDVLGAQEGVQIVGDRFVFSSEVLFPPGGAQLSPEGERQIAKIAGILRSVASDIPPEIDWVIRVDGHTDDVPLSGAGQFRDNWELSQARALSVVRFMSDFLGIPPDRLSANGFGQHQPLNRANTEEARAQNRRIELKFTEK